MTQQDNETPSPAVVDDVAQETAPAADAAQDNAASDATKHAIASDDNAASGETVDPSLENFAPMSQMPGPLNTDNLPGPGESLAMHGAMHGGMTPAAPTMGPTVGCGDEEAAKNAEPMTPLQLQQLEEQVIDAMRTVYDPEIPVNIYELGLIYDLTIDPQGRALVEMTLTSPACPVAGILPGEVEQKVLSVDGVHVSKVELVWDPPWSPDMMSEAAQLQLGFF